MEVLPTPIPRFVSIYGTRIYLVEDGKMERRKVERQLRKEMEKKMPIDGK